MDNRVVAKLNQGVAAWRAASFKPLESPAFRAMWIASTASNFGSVIQSVGASWLMTRLDSSPHMVAFVQTAALAPMMFLAFPAGALADNGDRRLQMLISQIVGLLAAASLAILFYFHFATPWVLLAATFVIGSAVAVYQPAWQASVGELVQRPALPAAIALNALSFNIARSLAPALGGALIALMGIGATFVLNAVSFVALIWAITRLKFEQPAQTLPPEPMGAALLAGLRYVSMSPVLYRTILRGALFGFGASALWALTPLIASGRLGGGPFTYGLLLGGFGLGSLLAALSAAYVRTHVSNERIFMFATAAFGAATLALHESPSLALSIALMSLAGAGWIFAFSTVSTCVQLFSPRWVVGRAVALSQVGNIGSIAIGAAFWGALAEDSDLGTAFLAAGVFMLAGLFAGRLAPLPPPEMHDLSPTGDHEVRAPGVNVTAQTGPVIVTVEYRVPASDVATFQALIYELGRVRRRDGATRWSVHQDLDQPDLWIEHVESPTWMAFLRRVHRATMADKDLRDRLAAYRVPGGIHRRVDRPPGSSPLS